MQIPILSGVYADDTPEVRTAYPINMTPVPKPSGVSAGYIKPADGIVPFSGGNGFGPGRDRGGIEWQGRHYRVMGRRLVEVTSTGVVIPLAEVAGISNVDPQAVKFAYSFDRLGIVSRGQLYYWDGSGLTVVTDPDLGNVIDIEWVDGYFVLTDGEFIIVTELNDPTQIDPLKYGSSEIDPDPVLAILKLRNEIYALNRFTIEAFDNVGGEFFPFQRIEGAQIQKGVIGTDACCVFADTIAFMGGGKNEPVAVYAGVNAQANKLSTHEVDTILSKYTEQQLSTTKLEARKFKNHEFLYIHLPDRTLVYDAAASSVTSQPVWFILCSSAVGFARYRAHNMVWVYDKWVVGDPLTNQLGYLDDTVATHWGEKVRWEFGIAMLYNEGRGAIIHELELVTLTGRINPDDKPMIYTSYSLDGVNWSLPRPVSLGNYFDRSARIVWYRQGSMRNWRIQRFEGDSSVYCAILRLQAKIEPLAH